MVTREQVIDSLAPDEIDYARVASRLDSTALPILADLVRSDSPDLAAKAASLAALISGKGQVDVLTLAAHSAEPTVRLAGAAGLEALPADVAAEVAPELLRDPDVGVRKVAAFHLGEASGQPVVRDALVHLAEADPDPALRALVVKQHKVD